MASSFSSSSSFNTREIKHDVFLSFRGEDTRNNFTSHLYEALHRRGINVFIDNKLNRGDEVSPSLMTAIHGSKISVVIFSKDYASSSWCLEELANILECKKDGQIVIPIFYHIRPSDVRNQTGNFEKAFAKHEERCKDEVLRWRIALKEAANLSGWHLDDTKSEANLTEKIIYDILKRLSGMSQHDYKDLVGVESMILKIEYLFQKGINDVCTLGIWGMGGIGKTTIAGVAFNELSSQFESSYFVQNVREESENPNGLIHLRHQLLSTILEDKNLCIGTPNIGNSFIKKRLRRKKIFIVFDDVTHLEQIELLIGDLNFLGLGSRVIITTRDKQVLRNCKVDEILEVDGLFGEVGFQLFCRYAFKQDLPLEGYVELSNKAVTCAKGVPLALKVLGSFLHKRKKKDWESAIDRLEKSPHKDIQKVLQISYDFLDDDEKNMFLDIACFFKGWNIQFVKEILDAIDLCVPILMGVLADKALITISKDTITMHDLIQEMGREIVRQESINNPGQRSRLWDHHNIYRVLTKNMGTEAIRGICFDMFKLREIHLNPHSFSNMNYLRFLIANKDGEKINKVHGFEGIEFDFSELRYLYWPKYPYRLLPSNFLPENLVVLKMRNSNLEQLWSGIQDLANLKEIDLSYSVLLLKIPDLSLAQKLYSLILEGCTSLFEITPLSIKNVNELVKLNLRNCRSLTSLPIGIQSKSLKEVILSGCSSLKTAPKISCNMEQLHLDGTAIKEFSSCIEYPSRLFQLNLRNCSRLERLPSNFGKLTSLKYLYISGCSKLDRLPKDFGNLESLVVLEANGTALREGLSSIKCLKNLLHLSLESCKSEELARSLTPILSNLRCLRSLNLNDCRIKELPNSLGQLSSLIDLLLAGNNFESMPTSIMNLSNLYRLHVNDCNMLQSLPKLPCSVQDLRAWRCKSLRTLSGLIIPNYGCYNGTLCFINSFNLDWNALKTILNDAVFKMYSDTTIRSRVSKLSSGCIGFPGTEIPEWFNFQSSGSPIVLPPGSFNHNFFGFVFSTVVSFQRDCKVDNIKFSFPDAFRPSQKLDNVRIEFELYAQCKDGCIKRKFFVYCPDDIVSDHVFVGYYCDKFEFLGFSEYTEATIYFDSSEHVKKCGVRLLFTQEFEEPTKESNRIIVLDEEEPPSKRLKALSSFKGESSSRCRAQPLHEEESELFNPSTSQSRGISLLDLNELPQDDDGTIPEPSESGFFDDDDEPQPRRIQEFKFF